MRREYSWWEQALRKVAPDPVSGDPQCGFYKMSSGPEKPADAVAIWLDEGRIVARVGMTFFEPDEVWERCCRSPITFEDYQHFLAYGVWKNHPATADGKHTRDLTKAEPIY